MPLGGDEVNSGYKGYGLAMFVELITSLMSGAAVGHNVRHWNTTEKVANLGQCFAAINPEMFAPDLPGRMQILMDHLRTLEPIDPEKPVLVPGDPERNSRFHVEDEQGGAILYTSNHILTYRELAESLKIKPMEAFQIPEKKPVIKKTKLPDY